MKTFYLRQEKKSGRLFIDESLHDECEEIGSCEARTWREARENLAKD